MNLNQLTVQPLRPEYQNQVGFELAVEKTKNNGIDEIFFEHQGTKYIAYDADQINIKGVDDIRASAQFQSSMVQILHTDNEHNHWKEKTWNTSKNLFLEALPDGIGGAAAAAFVAKIGLGNKLVKTAALAGFITSFVKEGISVGLADSASYQDPDWSYINRITAAPQKSAHHPQAAQVSQPIQSAQGNTLKTLPSGLLGQNANLILGH